MSYLASNSIPMPITDVLAGVAMLYVCETMVAYNCQPSPPDAERAARRQRMRAALLQKNHAPRAATQYSPRLSRTPFFVTSLYLHTMACLRRLYVTVSPELFRGL
jgi:hypothetical protein